MSESKQILSVRSAAVDENLVLEFEFKGKRHHLQRPKDENLSKALTRINLNINKRGKKNSCEDTLLIEAHLTDLETGSPVPGDTPNSQAWCTGRALVVGECYYELHVNPPTVTSLTVTRCVIVDHPMVPQVELAFSDLECCSWTWRCLDRPLNHPGELGDLLSNSTCRSNAAVYWPTSEDQGHALAVVCVPAGKDGRLGRPVYTITQPVEAAPFSPAISRRHLETPTLLAAGQFRVVSYNILADVYASTEYASQVLYPYCKKEALNGEYRQSRIVRELLGYHGDVVCLQEVGSRMYVEFIQPCLAQAGYKSCLQLKGGTVPEGEAVFYNTSKFEHVWDDFASLSNYLRTDPSCSDLREALQKVPAISDELTSRHTIMQLVVLRCLHAPHRLLCVANTHLYFHPDGDHIRLLQTELCLRYLKRALENIELRFQNGTTQLDLALVFAGDFNSCPCTAAYQLMAQGRVPKGHVDWIKHRLPPSLYPKCTCGLVTGTCRPQGQECVLADGVAMADGSVATDGGAAVDRAVTVDEGASDCTGCSPDTGFQGLNLEHNFNFQSACGIPPFTNYTEKFVGTLDYIFVGLEHLEVTASVSLPSLEEVREMVALPSVHFPSDHVALVCTVSWK